MKIGAIDLDYVKDIDKPKSRPTELVWGAGLSGPIPFEDVAEPEKVTLTGTLVKNATFVKTLEQQIEDLLALTHLNAAYNSVNVADLKGFLSVSGIKPKVSASKVGLRETSLDAWLYPSKQYQRLIASQPVVLTNSFSFALGVNDIDNYLALPIGASYRGGDGITITRAAEDGTLTYMLASSAKDVKFDLSADEINVGEVKVWDDMNLTEPSWIRIFNREHTFTGKQVLQNGLYRIIIDAANEYITLYYWSGAAYTKIDDFRSGTFSTVKFISLLPDLVSLELDSGVTVDVVRGHPPQIDTGNSDLLATSLTFVDQSTSTENYLSLGTSLHIASNLSFSVIGGIRNLGKGKKWIFYQTDAVIAEDIAHQAMVSSGLQRELILRSAEKITQYGVTWNESTADSYTRTGALQGVAVGSSPGNALLPIQSRMRGCVINDAGVRQYYLDPADWTKKADGSASVLTGADGQVKVEVPKFYERYLYAGTTHLHEVNPVAKTGFTIHPGFIKNGVEVDNRYYSAFEGVLYDVSAGIYANGLYLTAASTVFAVTTNVITQASRTNPFSRLEVGDKIVVSGTTNNNGTKTVSVVGAQSITVSEALVTETAASAVIQTEKDWTATTGDKLCSVSGKAPINYGVRANFRAAAKNRGAGWRQRDYDLESAVQLLYLIEYASFNSQSMIGAGLTDWVGATWIAYNDYNPINVTGLGNAKGNGTFNLSGGSGVVGSYMKYRGIENWYGNLWKWVDGININANVPYVSNNDTQFADDTPTNYTALGVTLSNADGWQSKLAKISRGFLPLTVGASGSPKITDYYYQSSGWRVVGLGGNANDGACAGAFCMYAASASGFAYQTIGGRLAF